MKIINSPKSNLTNDRQTGIDAAFHDLIVMIDSDHRLLQGDIESLINDLEEYDLDIVQSCLISYKNNGFWESAEESSWNVSHNIPGPKNMIGTAPAIYRKKIFKKIKFNSNITSTIDDTDFIYRLKNNNDFKIGIGKTQIRQYHYSNFKTFLTKFMWYGKGDIEFCFKNPKRSLSMLVHLLIRYPLFYSFKAVLQTQYKAIPFFILQGFVRFFGMVYFFKSTYTKARTYYESA